MKSKIFLLAILSFFSILYYCNCDRKLSTEPEAAKYEPGSRNYIWELDTLNMPMNYISSVWGAAPNDVWAVGAGGTEYDRLLHYDGEKWSTYTNEPILCGGFCLYGFSANDVWMGGQAGWGVHGAGIWHYDGIQWNQAFVYDDPDAYSIEVTNIWGTSPNDIYFTGTISYFNGKIDKWRGFVVHFNGSTWNELVKADFNSQFLKIRKSHNQIIIQSYKYGNSAANECIEFYKIINNDLKKIYSFTHEEVGWASLHLIDGEINIVAGKDVYLYKNEMFTKIITFEQSNFSYQIYGRHKNDLFVAMDDGIAHYNGINVEYLYTYYNSQMGEINDPLIFADEVFFCITNPMGGQNKNNLILHGILNQEGE